MFFEGNSDKVTEMVYELHEQEGNDQLSNNLDGVFVDLYGHSESEIEAMEDFLEFFLAD